MADSVDRVFGHALNTVNKIQPGAQKPPAADRLALYGLYKQAMEGDVSALADRPGAVSQGSSGNGEMLRKEQEKWDAWKTNEGLTRTEAKRGYIEKLISTMHEYASGTDEARELVGELEFVWDQIKSNSQQASEDSGRSGTGESPLEIGRSGYLTQNGSSGHGTGGIGSSAAAMENVRTRGGGETARAGQLTVLSPVSQADEDEVREEEEGDEFVDAPISQVDVEDFGNTSEPATSHGGPDASYPIIPRAVHAPSDARWRKRIESSLIKLTTEVAALREQLESRRFFSRQRRHSLLGWALRLSWWAVQLFVADAVLLWVVILYLRRRQDRRLEGAIRVLLGDAVAQVRKVTGREMKIPAMPKVGAS